MDDLEVLKPNTQKLTIKDVIPENTLSEEAKNKLSFKNFQTNTFGRDICNGKITLKEPDGDQSSLLVKIMNFNSKIKPQNPEQKQKKKDILINLCPLLDGREKVLDAFENRIFPLKMRRTFRLSSCS